MSYHEYLVSRDISDSNPPFYALIMAALRQADTTNATLICACWPEVAAEFEARYNAPAGLIGNEV